MGDPALEKELRRQRSTLRILGTGVIALALWASIKPFLGLLLIPNEELDEVLRDSGTLGVVIVLLIAALIVLLVSSVRLWLGRSARAEGLGEPRGRAYMIVAFVLFALDAAMLLATLILLPQLDFGDKTVLDLAASFLVETTSTVIMGELAFTARKVKRLSAQAKEA